MKSSFLGQILTVNNASLLQLFIGRTSHDISGKALPIIGVTGTSPKVLFLRLQKNYCEIGKTC